MVQISFFFSITIMYKKVKPLQLLGTGKSIGIDMNGLNQ